MKFKVCCWTLSTNAIAVQNPTLPLLATFCEWPFFIKTAQAEPPLIFG